jgi:hypothetical protein
LTTYGVDRTTGGGGSGSSTTVLLADGSQPLTADWDVGNFDITALSFYASGTSPVFSLTRALNSQDNAVVFNEADGSARWRLTHAGTTDAFALQRYNASGVLQDSPISVSNSTGLITVTALTATGDLQFGTVAADTFPRRNSSNNGWDHKTPQQVADEIVGPLSQKGEVQSLSGSSVDFTGIPSWVTQLDIAYADVSHNDAGTPTLSIQIGDSGGIETSGYSGAIGLINGSTPATSNHPSSSFNFIGSSLSSQVTSGTITLTLVDASTNLWSYSSVGGVHGSTVAYYAAGSKALSATLDRFRISVSSGSFDTGKVSVRYR